jgi:uncharacterized protein YjbJ (UPF0337 family)
MPLKALQFVSLDDQGNTWQKPLLYSQCVDKSWLRISLSKLRVTCQAPIKETAPRLQRSTCNPNLETMMDSDRIKGKWHQLKGEIKRRWGKVTDDDLTEAEGDMEKLVGKIQERTGERREAIEKWLDSQSG